MTRRNDRKFTRLGKSSHNLLKRTLDEPLSLERPLSIIEAQTHCSGAVRHTRALHIPPKIKGSINSNVATPVQTAKFSDLGGLTPSANPLTISLE